MRISRVLPTTLLAGGLIAAGAIQISAAAGNRPTEPSGFEAAGASLAASLPRHTSAAKPLARGELAALHRIAEAQRAAQRAAVEQAVPAGVTLHEAQPVAASLAELRQCEASGNYATNTGNGYYGAYQFDVGTWRGLGLAGLPSQAPPEVQDAAAATLHDQRGWSPWPACSARLGLR